MLTTLVVVVTANHYWIDALVAALLLGLVLLVTPRPPEVPPSRLWLRLTGRSAQIARADQTVQAAQIAQAIRLA